VSGAVDQIRRVMPDLVFLDVQMPGGSGFELLDRVEVPLRVVFVTAFDTYAVRAFDVNAIDYLLKPVQPARLATAIDRLFAPAASRQAAEVGERDALRPDDLLFLDFRGRARFVRVSSIRSITADGPYSQVTTKEGATAMVLRSMREWEQRLPSGLFLRIHRSAIVNAAEVSEVRDVAGYRCAVHLAGEATPLMMSRRHARRLRQRMS
jgi:two-component system LytT family response regulator